MTQESGQIVNVSGFIWAREKWG